MGNRDGVAESLILCQPSYGSMVFTGKVRYRFCWRIICITAFPRICALPALATTTADTLPLMLGNGAHSIPSEVSTGKYQRNPVRQAVALTISRGKPPPCCLLTHARETLFAEILTHPSCTSIRTGSTSQTASSGVSSRRPDSEDERAGNGSIVSRIEEGRSSRASVAAMERIAGGVDYQMNNPFANGTTPAIQRRSGAWAAGQQEMWDFERLASTPLLASAFEDFSRKALCHESVLFLSEVSRYDFMRQACLLQYSRLIFHRAVYREDYFGDVHAQSGRKLSEFCTTTDIGILTYSKCSSTSASTGNILNRVSRSARC